MLDDLRALVEFAQAGSITVQPSVYTDTFRYNPANAKAGAALGAELLDRSVKPPRLNSLGSRVLEQARDLLQRTEALKSLTSRDAELTPLAHRARRMPWPKGRLSNLFRR